MSTDRPTFAELSERLRILVADVHEHSNALALADDIDILADELELLRSGDPGVAVAPPPPEAKCRFCGDDIRLDKDGDWEDPETHISCASGPNTDKPHQPASVEPSR